MSTLVLSAPAPRWIPSVGARVVVTHLTDDTVGRHWLGRCGVVVGLETETCGASPADPMIDIRCGDQKELFWREELTEVRS